MSTPNFSYENRCIVVTDEDFEYGNCPELAGTNYGTRCYPSMEIDASEYGGMPSPIYHAIVLTNGYYTGACVDFVELEHSIADEFSYYFEPETVTEAIDALTEESGLSRYRVAKLAGRRDGRDMWAYWGAACEAVDEYLRDRETELCNTICNRIKSKYGLCEYACTEIYSNGEAIYSKVG